MLRSIAAGHVGAFVNPYGDALEDAMGPAIPCEVNVNVEL